MFDTPEWSEFFASVCFKPPGRKALSERLLSAICDRTLQLVMEVALAAQYIQIVTDGSGNISKWRVENVCFLVNNISYYWSTKAVGSIRATTEWTVSNLLQEAKAITQDQLWRWVSYSSDSCNKQRKVWRILSATVEGKHVLSAPCDSHGLQLIFKDLLWPGIDRDRNQIDTAIGKFFHHGPNKILSYFTSSPKQLIYLREIMATTTGGVKALITTVPTRWGTQFLKIKSINRSYESLKIYAGKPDDINEPIVDLKASHLHYNCDFWQHNKELERLLEPLHNLQKMCESNKARLNKVYTHWATVEAHLREWSSWSEDTPSYYHRIGKNGWQALKAQQVLPIHYVAYELNPQNWSKLTDPTEQEIIDNFILERGGVDGFDQLCQYRHKNSAFNPLRECWRFTEAIKPFWNISRPSAHALSTIALELYATTANSVPSERAFSTMNLLQSKLRNRLSTEKMNMLCFIYTNSRSLRAHKGISIEER
ncbi:hypothetical protein GcM3_030035, partial [Golovinomyces cichoracearum]